MLAAKRHPDLLAERARFAQQPDAKPWDKWLAPAVALGGGLIPLVTGLDALFGWSAPFRLPVKLAALLIILAGYVLGSYALLANRFFSGMVRIQTERNHQVVSSGPYRWMRHPGYAGALATYLAVPFSWIRCGRYYRRWSFLPCWWYARPGKMPPCRPNWMVTRRMPGRCATACCRACGRQAVYKPWRTPMQIGPFVPQPKPMGKGDITDAIR